jgi:hypothetical protein
MVVVVMLSLRATSLLLHAAIETLHSGHRLSPQVEDTAEGKAYAGNYNSRSFEKYQ